MKKPFLRTVGTIFGAWLCLVCATTTAQTHPPLILKDQPMQHITGSFDIQLTPQPAAPGLEDARLGRQTFSKQFHGDLNARSLGEMLSARSAVPGSAGYVAMERVTGTLMGRKGCFVLMHLGTMNRGAQHLTLQVVPDSATDALLGLTGQMGIQITNGQHFYTFDFSLP